MMVNKPKCYFWLMPTFVYNLWFMSRKNGQDKFLKLHFIYLPLGYQLETGSQAAVHIQSLNHKQSFWNFIVVSFRKE